MDSLAEGSALWQDLVEAEEVSPVWDTDEEDDWAFTEDDFSPLMYAGQPPSAWSGLFKGGNDKVDVVAGQYAVAARTNDGWPIYFPMGASNFPTASKKSRLLKKDCFWKKRGFPQKICYECHVKALERLNNMGLVHVNRMKPNPEGRYQSSMWALEKLLRLPWAEIVVYDVAGQTPQAHAEIVPDRSVLPRYAEACRADCELIQLHDGENLLRYNRSPRVWAMLQDLKQLNAVNVAAALTFDPIKASHIPGLDRIIQLQPSLYRVRYVKEKGETSESQTIIVNLLRKSMFRRFKGDFEHAGRFFGGGWQTMPKWLRTCLLIDGEPIFEFDYKAMHLMLMCALIGRRVHEGEDLYQGIQADGCERHEIKRGVNIRLNAQSRASAIKALAEKLRGGRYVPDPERSAYKKATAIVDAIEKAHPEISDLTKEKGFGLRLQKMESDVANHVHRQLVMQGRPCLSIHDGFMVKASDQIKLQVATSQAIERTREKWIMC